MIRKTFVTRMPDKAGTFLRAAEIIARHGGNISRVSYNKAVDPNMLFVDVEAEQETLRGIEKDLFAIGYLDEKISETRVIEVSVKIPDRAGALLPVLEILNAYDINISYMNSSADVAPTQDFRFGLLIEKPDLVKTLLEDISRLYPVDIIECENAEESLDNTVTYIRLANEMQKLLGLTTEKTMEFISESNRVLQFLQSSGENAGKVFDYIRRFAHFVSDCRGDRYKTNIQKVRLSRLVTMYSIQPYCGSNTYLLASPGELVLIDTGYTIFGNELIRTVRSLVPDWDSRVKRACISHCDVDHCGLLYRLSDTRIIVNRKSAENFRRQAERLPDFREQSQLHLGYSRISRIISGYVVPDVDRMEILDEGTPPEHDDLLPIGAMDIGDLRFEILEGSGGHVYGEMVYACREAGVVFTGDILVNIAGFSRERAEFNSLAPFLMKSVNVSSRKASVTRHQVTQLIGEISEKNGRATIVCGGHGPVSEMVQGRLESLDR